jgi:polygalacturonase
MKMPLKVPYPCLKLAMIALLTLPGLPSWAQIYNVKDFGAVADGRTMNTTAIQKAIDKCSKTGGKVLFPKGTFLSGTLYLKNNVHINLDEGAILLGSSHFTDYPSNDVLYPTAFTHSNGKSNANKAFLFAEGIQNITLSGTGTIDGNGGSKEFDLNNDSTSPQSRLRPCMISFINCKNIKVIDLHLTNSAYWLQNYQSCEGLVLKGLKVYNHCNYNVDGMDIDCKNVLVEDCDIDTDDDAICLKSHDENRVCENVVVRNCRIATNCNAIKFGTLSIAGFKNINISNCTIKKASEDRIRHWQTNLQFIGQPITVVSGIALEMVDGGLIDNINISNIRMTDVQTPIFIVMGDRRKSKGHKDSTVPTSWISNITLSNITASSQSKMASSISGLPGTNAENIKLENIVLTDMGTGTEADARVILPEKPQAYPENRMFGQIFPASGLFVRHVKNLQINGLSLLVRNPDHRPALVLDDVKGANIHGLKVKAPEGVNATISVINSSNILFSKPDYSGNGKPFVQIKGKSTDVDLSGFDKYRGWLKILPNDK